MNLGYENRQFVYNFTQKFTPEPYHYFEIWTSSMIYKIGNLNASLVFYLTIPSLFVSQIFLALLAVIERSGKPSFIHILCIIILLFAVSFMPVISLVTSKTVKEMYVLGTHKWMSILLFVIWFALFFYYGKKKEAYYILLCLPFVNIITIVWIYGVIGVVLTWNLLIKKKIDKAYLIPYVVSVLIYLFFVICGPERSSSVREPFKFSLLRLYFTQAVMYSLYYIHIIIALYLLNRKYFLFCLRKFFPILAITFIVTESFSIFLRGWNYDATQFPSVSIPVCLFVFLVCVFLNIVSRMDWTNRNKIIIGGFALVSFLLTFSVCKISYNSLSIDELKYRSEILSKLPTQNEYRIGFYRDANDERGWGGGLGRVDGLMKPDFLDYYHNNVWHFTVNKGDNEFVYGTENSPYRDFYMAENKRDTTLTDDEIRLKYIKENKIEYLEILSGVLSDSFLSHFILIAENKESGESFYKLAY
ncbi:hypothetical protein [Parabacteroides bouchesdurhonensis]|uniref:hypothetical protein n=1 Tax=Parabacteroides bouchesdurhonensis TaxID=1936995 RepID=UPI00131D9195|nr:hypothetical protein [Parabacteroides bouchesdurhonensis]